MASRSDAEVMTASLTEPAAFSDIFDRYGETMLRFLVRRVGVGVGEDLLGELFRIAFERRDHFDPSFPSVQPWLYGIGANLLRRHRRSEDRRLRAMARLQSLPARADDGAESPLETQELLAHVVDLLDELPDGDRDALLLVVFETLSYQDAALALAVPVGHGAVPHQSGAAQAARTSRCQRATRRRRRGHGCRETTAMNDELDLIRRLRDDRGVDPASVERVRRNLMVLIDETTRKAPLQRRPDRIVPYLIYDDPGAAIDWLSRAFGFVELKEARAVEEGLVTRAEMEFGGSVIALGRPSIHGDSPRTGVSAMLRVEVDAVDAHYERACAAGAEVIVALEDAPWGVRRYQARDPEGHQWHFSQPLRARR